MLLAASGVSAFLNSFLESPPILDWHAHTGRPFADRRMQMTGRLQPEATEATRSKRGQWDQPPLEDAPQDKVGQLDAHLVRGLRDIETLDYSTHPLLRVPAPQQHPDAPTSCVSPAYPRLVVIG